MPSYRKGEKGTVAERVETLIKRHYPDMISTKEIQEFLGISREHSVVLATSHLVREGLVRRVYRGNFVWIKDRGAT